MKIEEFNKTRFGVKTIIKYKGEQFNVFSVDFEEKLIGFVENKDEQLTWIRCENCEIIENAHTNDNEKGIFVNAFYRAIPCYFNISTNEIKGRSWLYDLLIGINVWWDFEVLNLQELPIFLEEDKDAEDLDQHQTKTMTAEELEYKLRRLDDRSFNYVTSIPPSFLHEIWISRIKKYKLNLINKFKKDWCKKQRDECHQVFVNYGDADSFRDLDIAHKIRYAPEPE